MIGGKKRIIIRDSHKLIRRVRRERCQTVSYANVEEEINFLHITILRGNNYLTFPSLLYFLT
ncbi:hypothetical protein GIB67_018805 [Kingdonia uniflora]|uniref:Uncharacterized protein n=1 Tax=Kingdonia uniflora TaxID=39325 RepID=A0A7J7NDQ5_9MAGN|nr:hypothetical protein GIB67_018805 [Kingdonia uniflora]